MQSKFRFLWLFAFFCFFLSTSSYAFTSSKESFVATESSEWGLGSVRHWDSEAASDFVTFQRPLAWDAKWLRGERVFDLTTGSISSKQFLVYQRIKIRQFLTENLEFKFLWLKEADFEQDRDQIPLELKYSFNSKVAVSLFGSPSLYKSEDDLGLSLYVFPSREWELRASGIWGDYDRNQRNLGSDKWSEPPFALTVSVKRLPMDLPDNFLHGEFHWERPSRRTDAGTVTQSLAYESAYFSNWTGYWGTRILYDRAFSSNAKTTASRKRALSQFEYLFNMGHHVVRPGLNLFYRENRADGDQIIFHEILPTIWFQLVPGKRNWGTATPSIGYDATIFEKLHQSASDHNLEHRLNIKYDLQFKKSGHLALIFTFDLDHPGTGEAWEGGAGQFRLDF